MAEQSKHTSIFYVRNMREKYRRKSEKGAEEVMNEIQFLFFETVDFISDCNNRSLMNTNDNRYLYYITFKYF